MFDGEDQSSDDDDGAYENGHDCNDVCDDAEDKSILWR